jgi:hypothetical protein
LGTIGEGPAGTHLELVLEEIFLGGHFAVETQQTLLLWAHRLGEIVSESSWRLEVRRGLTLISTLFCWWGFMVDGVVGVEVPQSGRGGRNGKVDVCVWVSKDRWLRENR